MNKVSGDIYAVYNFGLPGRPPITWRVYERSWIIDNPTVTWSRCHVTITGSVRYWTGIYLATSATIVIRWGQGGGDQAEATFTTGFGTPVTYQCSKMSDAFRDLTLEVDVCTSVNAAPVLPSYDTDWHADRPGDLPQRVLEFERCYREAGVAVTVRPERTIIDDSGADFTEWTPGELHDVMETHFGQFGLSWPRWEMWGLLAGGQFENPSVAGIMFDAAAGYGGAGEAPERQGFAVFRNHSWFNDLVTGPPANQAQAWAMRQFLYTWVHEAGHAFNFLHSWNKGRPEALSWMNYPQYVVDFWDNFRFRFDDEELVHMRHGNRAAVIMGGDPWASGGHLEDTSGLALAQAEGSLPIELLLRSKEYFEFLEPVVIEFRLRNALEGIPLDVDTRLHPEFGTTVVYIQRPDRTIVHFDPIMCKVGTPAIRTLQPPRTSAAGADRYSEAVDLTFGRGGFAFDHPGQYVIRAFYIGTGDVLIPSNQHRIRIGRPITKEEDRLAQDFFSPEVGMTIALGGSRSPYLEKGNRVLTDIAERYADSPTGAQAAAILAPGLSRPFYRVNSNKVLTQAYPAETERALELTERALQVYRRESAPSANLAQRKITEEKVKILERLDRKDDAKNELKLLREQLERRGANASVLDELKAREEK